jgi:ribose transport system permease protein
VLFAIWDSPYFFSINNFLLILNAAALTAVFAAGVAVSAMSGVLDLSVAGVAAFAGVVSARLLKSGTPIWIALLVGLAVGIVAGFVNGAVTLRGFNPLVVTIGTLGILSGLASMVSKGYNISGLKMLEFMGTRRYMRIPAPVYGVGVLYVVGTIFLTKTRHGLRLMAVGGNAEAVRRVGLNSNRYKILGFVLCSACAAIGGLVTAATVTEASPQASLGIIFDALTAVALAGVSLAGGRGSLPKVLVGAIILATIADGLTIGGVPPYWSRVAAGTLMILALVLDKVLSNSISNRLITIGGFSTHDRKAK